MEVEEKEERVRSGKRDAVARRMHARTHARTHLCPAAAVVSVQRRFALSAPQRHLDRLLGSDGIDYHVYTYILVLESNEYISHINMYRLIRSRPASFAGQWMNREL